MIFSTAVHAFNALRREFLIDQITRHYGRQETVDDGLAGLCILDVGCGAGLLCKPLAERDAEVVGIDAAARNVEFARGHAGRSGPKIVYRHCLAYQLLEGGIGFDVVLNMEVVEHVAQPRQLMQDCGALVVPGGLIVVAIPNHTLRTFAIAIVGAEYKLGWLPKGTHDLRRFLKPAEKEKMIVRVGLKVIELAGTTFSPFVWQWKQTRDSSVNVMLVAEKAAAVWPGSSLAVCPCAR